MKDVSWTVQNFKFFNDNVQRIYFLNMENWPEHVVIRSWTFKKAKDAGTKEIATGNSEQQTQETIGEVIVSDVESNVADKTNWYSQTSDIVGETSNQHHGEP